MITLYNNMPISIFGSAHDAEIGIIIKNFPKGIKINHNKIKEYLKLRTSFSIALSARKESDNYLIKSGVEEDITNGEDLTIIIENKDIDSKPYLKQAGIMRPSHADYVAWKKYGIDTLVGGGIFSGRMTALYMILGALCDDLLVEQNIFIYSRIKSLKDIHDLSKRVDYEAIDPNFPVADASLKEAMLNLLSSLKDDSVGGLVEVCIKGINAGIGGPLFDSLQAQISRIMLTIPGLKGIEFGSGFDITKMLGSDANDQMQYDDENLVFLSNNSGGIQGGISSGEDIIFTLAVKPTPSIAKEQKTIDVINRKNVNIKIEGRHDKAFIFKLVHVASSLAKYAICEILRGTTYETTKK